MKKRVGIVTLYGLWNYGNRLQNFAVDYILQKEGYLPETFVPQSSPLQRRIKEFVANVLGKIPFAPVGIKKISAFIEFDRKLAKKYIKNQAHAHRVEADYLFVAIGSDQIWHPSYGICSTQYHDIREIGNYKIALSPSISADVLPETQKAPFKNYLKTVDQISVREFRGSQIVEELTGREAPTLVDPTLVLTKEEWAKIASTRMRPSTPYVVLYLLGEKDKDVHVNINIFATENQLEIVAILDKDATRYYPAGPDDFVGLISNAQAVITDSYHAVIFGIQFEKEVFWVPRRGGTSMNSRFETLQQQLGLSFVANDRLPGSKTVVSDSKELAERLELERKKYIGFLRKAIQKRLDEN